MLSEAEDVAKLLLCVSSYVFKGLKSYFPGLDAFFMLNLRSIGLEPETALLFDPETYARTLIQILGSTERARQVLTVALPKRRAFQELIQVILSRPSREELEEEVLTIVRKYSKDIEKECSEIV